MIENLELNLQKQNEKFHRFLFIYKYNQQQTLHATYFSSSLFFI